VNFHVKDSAFVGTPFNPRTAPQNKNQRWVAWDRYHLVDIFTDFLAELEAIRQSVVMIDMSPLAKHLISGPDAQKLVDQLITRDATKIEVNQIYYTPWCNERGKVVGDGLVCRLDETTYRFSADPSYQWFVQNASGLDVQISDISEMFAILALQGPLSPNTLEAATDQSWKDLPFSSLRKTMIGDVEVEVMRQGFTGEVGYELWVEADDSIALWDAMMEAGAPFKIQPIGFYAHDVARIEAGLIIVGPDYTGAGPDESRGAAIPVTEEFEASPFELGLNKFIDFNKGDFIGKSALLAEQSRGGPLYRMVGLEFDWKDIVMLFVKHNEPPNVLQRVRWNPIPVYLDDRRVGRATSVTWSPTIKKMIGFGFLEKHLTDLGTRVFVNWLVDGSYYQIGATVVDLPFLKHRRT
jgi:aminomethyltransferase